jgi:DNA replication initiation complex subunit (GINS family)|tara:strand:- start:1709 stop:2392 length:684 start_codon:yes stop_codon:yes gene_type:complete
VANILNNLFNAKTMSTDLMTLRDLRVQTLKERREGRLTNLPSNFYNRLKNLEANIKKFIENSKDDSQKLDKANNDVRKFLDMKLEMHKHRERKLTDLARERINGQNPNTDNVHPSETEYLKSLCEVIENHRKRTLLGDISEEIIELEVPTKEEFKGVEETIDEKVPEKNEIADDYIEVEILEDLPTFTGMDAKNYTLKINKTEIIPIYNAKILSDAGKVKIVNEVKA